MERATPVVAGKCVLAHRSAEAARKYQGTPITTLRMTMCGGGRHSAGAEKNMQEIVGGSGAN